ncbi:phosphonoacetaldehyde reductase [Lysinibacillus sp. FSL R7-0073]|uniref:phosphonoacetaldehyde reductase n=1 Tax=Lysinibacillus TaxID=400634 RepID=UPI002E2410B2|nr:phosphonoacetaldehyde reductase [Lysinibacillus fusiformis]
MNQYKNPVQIEFGRGAIEFLPRFIQKRSALLITSQGFVKRGVVERLQKNNSEITQLIANIQPNPTIEQLKDIRTTLDYEKFDVIVALGGGSVIDAAKAIAPFKKEDKLELLSLLENGLTSDINVKPIIAIPTTAGTGSEVTMWGTVWDDKNKKKYSISDERLYCEVAILDVELHLSIPAEITLQTGLDALSHSLEAIWNKNSNQTSNLYAVQAAKTIIDVLPKLMSDLSNLEFREQMLIASYRAGLAFSNTQTAIAHAMSYYMTLEKGIPHGIAASFTLPAITKVAMSNPAISNILVGIFGDNPSEFLYKLLTQLKITSVSQDYQLSQEDWGKILASLSSTVRSKNSMVESSRVVKLLMQESVMKSNRIGKATIN